MANCKNCGAELAENAKFCTICGAQVLAVNAEKAVEEVKEAVEEVTASAEEVKAAVEEIKTPAEEGKAVVEEVKTSAEEVKAAVEETTPVQHHVYVPAPDKKIYEPKVETVTAAPASQYYVPETAPAGNKIADPMGLGRWIGLSIVMAIPVVNFIVWIVFLCGGSKYQTKINYIRGKLIASLIIIAVELVAVLLLAILAPQILAAVSAFFSSYIPSPIA